MKTRKSPHATFAFIPAALSATATLAASFSENFDAVMPPATPSGWTATSLWFTSAASPEAGPYHARAFGAPSGQNAYALGDQRLTSPPIPITHPGAILSFRQQLYLSAYCGARLEISIDGGDFVEIITASGQFLEGGYAYYSATAHPFLPNLWNGAAAYFTTRVKLPDSAAGLVVQVRWHVTDTAASPGQQIFWNVDTVKLCDPACPADITVERDPDTCGKVVDYAPPSSPACDCNCNPPPGSTFPVGATVVTCTSSAGLTCTFNITITESTAPNAQPCGPDPDPATGCGGGMCGAGAVPSLPLTIFLLSARRRRNRSRSGRRSQCQSEVRNSLTTATKKGSAQS